MIFDYSKLRGRIIEKFGTYSAFAEAFCITPSLLSRKLGNEVGFSREEIKRCATLLDFGLDEYGEYFFTEKVQDVRQSC